MWFSFTRNFALCASHWLAHVMGVRAIDNEQTQSPQTSDLKDIGWGVVADTSSEIRTIALHPTHRGGTAIAGNTSSFSVLVVMVVVCVVFAPLLLLVCFIFSLFLFVLCSFSCSLLFM